MHDTARETVPCYNHAPLPKKAVSQRCLIPRPCACPVISNMQEEICASMIRLCTVGTMRRMSTADSGAYGESLEEDLEEEEEEEEEPVLVEEDDEIAVPPVREPAPISSIGWRRQRERTSEEEGACQEESARQESPQRSRRRKRQRNRLARKKAESRRRRKRRRSQPRKRQRKKWPARKAAVSGSAAVHA